MVIRGQQREQAVGLVGSRVQTLVRLLAFILAHGMKQQQANCGNPCPVSIANARSHIRTFGQHMGRFCQANGTLAVGKETGKTSYVERFNNTLRQRVSRLVRKTLSFSKSLENHIGAIWYFIHYYNASLLV
jgi:IS1 family transposase